MTRFAFEISEIWKEKPFAVNMNRFRTHQAHNRYNKYLTALFFSIRTVSYGSSFFLFARAISSLQYGPPTRLLRGISSSLPTVSRLALSRREWSNFTRKTTPVVLSVFMMRSFIFSKKVKTTPTWSVVMFVLWSSQSVKWTWTISTLIRRMVSWRLALSNFEAFEQFCCRKQLELLRIQHSISHFHPQALTFDLIIFIVKFMSHNAAGFHWTRIF